MKIRNFVVVALLLVFASAIGIGSGVPAQGKGIHSQSAAKKAALKKVPSATVKEIELDDGGTNYDVELYKGKKEYNLKFNVSDGKLMEYGWDIMNPGSTNQNRKTITKKAIKKKAKKKVKKATVDSVHLEYDDGMERYDITLSKGTKQYELVYDSKSGKLLEYEWKLLTKKTSSSKYIGLEKAKSIAQKKAPNATITEAKLDKDDGIAVYEISMREGSYEYDVEINAKTGSIIHFEKEIDD